MIKIIKKINAQIDEKKGDVLKHSYPITSNHILESILLAKVFIEQHFDDLYDGKDINGYSFNTREVLEPLQYQEDRIYGSAKALQLQVALFYMATVITGKNQFSEIDFQLYKENNNLNFADEAAIVHIAPFPLGFDVINNIEDVKRFSWFFSDSKTEQGLLTIPAG